MSYNNGIKTFCYLIVTTIGICTLSAQETEIFKSDVDTDIKPWSDREFYNDPENFQFAIVTDNTGGSRPGIFDIGVEKLNLMMPEFVLCVGDLIQGYTLDTVQIKKEWDEFQEKIDKLKVPFFYLPGNHDITNLVMQKEWEERYGKRYYSFNYKGVLYIIMDSNDDDDFSITEKQKEYVIDVLDENPDVRWTFVLMHHPIWKYNTNERFQEIETALKGRKHTVFAGHEHHYQHIERNNTNYYVLATTGGGSRLRGNRFGEFDHFVWMTMSNNGPIMANLRLDGILPHDVSNAETAEMARNMLQNTNFDFTFLANEGDQFENGTGYLKFKNDSQEVLNLNLSFLHHHDVDIIPATASVSLKPGDEKTIEISVDTDEAKTFDDIGFLKFYWKLSYGGAEYEDFYLDGNVDFPIERSVPDVFSPVTSKFVSNTEVSIRQPIDHLDQQINVQGKTISTSESIQLNESTTIEVQLKNEKGQVSAKAVKNYEKTSLAKGVKARKTRPGLKYSLYEGKWQSIPTFDQLIPSQSGSVNDFDVSQLASGDRNNFGIRYTGFIEIPEDGLYHFWCRADDMASFKIHDEVVCLDGTSDVTLPEGSDLGPTGVVALQSGFHPVTIDFIERQGNERLRFYYKLNKNSQWTYINLKDFFRTN